MPKSWAITDPERSATLLALPFRGFVRLVRPALVALNALANAALGAVQEGRAELAHDDDSIGKARDLVHCCALSRIRLRQNRVQRGDDGHAQLAEERNIPVAGVILVGVVNGTGGGMLRDVLVRDVPAILRPGQFVSLILLLACVMFVTLKWYAEVTVPQAAWASIGTFFVLRVLTIRFNWSTRSVLPESLSGPPPGGAQ